MAIVKIIIEGNEVRLLNNFNHFIDFLSSLFNVPICKKFNFPEHETKYNFLKKYTNNTSVNRANEYFKKLIESISVVFWKGRKWKGIVKKKKKMMENTWSDYGDGRRRNRKT
ncbi:hypothetical protein MKS88_002747 [Plasmodium brasilianum]|uniref:Uncharacterized protein n=2 Tax=Plasmodium (Plasmodium) TaxID=418103 RepID=A0A1A8W114_PLAMA|nr:hypothetical protein MKS88_002747 [Plasmodium brasilianum]SBS85341.1 conserved Plasmodium protein, unknown function [Plasmodium malariae]